MCIMLLMVFHSLKHQLTLSFGFKRYKQDYVIQFREKGTPQTPTISPRPHLVTKKDTE